MPNSLTPQQIEALLTQAQLAGLDAVSLTALRETLMMQSADLTAEQRFNLELMQAPQDTQDRVNTFTDSYSTINQDVMSKGKTALMNVSDSEWQAMVDKANGNG